MCLKEQHVILAFPLPLFKTHTFFFEYDPCLNLEIKCKYSNTWVMKLKQQYVISKHALIIILHILETKIVCGKKKMF